MVAIPLGYRIMDNMMKRNEKIKEAIQTVVGLALFAAIGVMLAWRG
jgi:hypothetical protein